MIKVEYNGSFPNACSGNLTITVDGKEVYNKSSCCSSSGAVWFDDDWNEHVEEGELTWDDASEFSEEIQEAVREELSKVIVCCGGCV